MQNEQPAGPTGSGAGAWVRKHRLVVGVVAVVVAIGIWTAVDHNGQSHRQDDGANACEKAVEKTLLPGYDPQITVTFTGKSSGDLNYDARTDDGDGQFQCIVSGSGSSMTVNVSDGID